MFGRAPRPAWISARKTNPIPPYSTPPNSNSALDRLQACNTKIIEPACGKEAVEVADMLIRGTFSRAATLSCDKYKHTSAECKSLLPPPDTKPKGGKSTSVLSKLISTITQV